MVVNKRLLPWLFLVVFAYFVWAAYWIFQSFIWGYEITSKFTLYTSLLKEPWWIALFYSSELGGVVCTSLRFIAGIFAFYAALLFLKAGGVFTSRVKDNVCRAFVFESGYYLALIPSVILGFVHPLFAEKLWYFNHTPGIPVLLVSGVTCLFMVMVIPSSLLKLRSKIMVGSSGEEIVRQICVVGVSYLFIVFWLNYSLSWIATTVPWMERAQPGIGILLEPISFVSFMATVFGLLAIALSALHYVTSYTRRKEGGPGPRRLGAIITAFGAYFILVVALYLVAGGYAGRPTVWHEMVVPHNPDLWCITFFPLGVKLLLTKSS